MKIRAHISITPNCHPHSPTHTITQIANAMIKLAQEATEGAPDILLLGSGGLALLAIPMTAVVFVVTSQGVFKKK